MNVRIAPLFASLLAVAFVPSAAATDITADLGVKITITESCVVTTGSTQDIDFGTHNRGTSATPIDRQGSLQLACSNGTPYTIAMNHGMNSTSETASDVNRRMAGPNSNYVPYGLYRDAARTQLWGSKIENRLVGTGAGVGTGTTPQTIPVYGRVKDTNFPAGTYLDTVVATIAY